MVFTMLTSLGGAVKSYVIPVTVTGLTTLLLNLSGVLYNTPSQLNEKLDQQRGVSDNRYVSREVYIIDIQYLKQGQQEILQTLKELKAKR